MQQQKPAYRELVVSVLAASIENIPISEMYAKALAGGMGEMFEDSTLSDDTRENVAVCLLCILNLKVEVQPVSILKECLSILKSQKSSSGLLHRTVSLSSHCLDLLPKASASLTQEELEQFLEASVRVLCATQSQLKFEIVTLLLQLVMLPELRRKESLDPIIPNLRMGLFDLLRSRTNEPLFVVLRCASEITAVLGNLDWAISDEKNTFFALLIALVGVEISMAFDKEQKASDKDSQMIMACLEMLELVMRNLRDESLLATSALLQLREKLNDINRVALEYLLVFSAESSKDDLRPQVATRIVSTWAFLDPEALREEEVIALIPKVVKKEIPWFLPVLSEHWAADDNIRDTFMVEDGVQEVCDLIQEHVAHVAELAIVGKADEMEQWNDLYWVNPYDTMISACSVVVTCCMAQREQRIHRKEAMIQLLAGVCKSLLGQQSKDDCSTLLAFVVAVMAQLVRISDTCKNRDIAERAAMTLSLYIPVALEAEGLTTVEAISDAIENSGDLFNFSKAIKDYGVAELIDPAHKRHWTVEQKTVATRLLSVLK
jgi:hypothetical protein